jgi:hypothetical protein
MSKEVAMRPEAHHPADEIDTEVPDLASWINEAEHDLAVAEDAEDSPREAPLAVEDYGTTVVEQARHEPLRKRLTREVPDLGERHRPLDPDRVSRTEPAGRLFVEDGPRVAQGDTGGLSAEESAMHLLPEPRSGATDEEIAPDERLAALEAELVILTNATRALVDAVQVIARALVRTPDEEPDEAADKISHAGRQARELLLAAREVRD